MTTQLLYGVSAVPAIIGLVQIAKQIGIPVRFAPVAAIALGILAALAGYPQGVTASSWPQAVITGIALGLSASGLYSGVSTVAATPAAGQTPLTAGSRVRRLNAPATDTPPPPSTNP